MKQVKVGVLGLFEGSPSRVLLGFERSFVTVLHKYSAEVRGCGLGASEVRRLHVQGSGGIKI